MVVAVGPNLGTIDREDLWFVGVGDEIAVSRSGDHRFIFCYSIFGDTIGYFSTSVILRQIGEAPNPVVRSVDGRVGNFSAVSQQVDGDSRRTETVLVVVINPILSTIDGYEFRHVRVGDGERVAIGGSDGAVNYSIVSRNIELLNRIDDL